MEYTFEWDPRKAHSNALKHGVTFEEATQVFEDPMALTIFDRESSHKNEDRWITLGKAQGRNYLVVIDTYRDTLENTVTIPVISARPATKHEIQQYEG